MSIIIAKNEELSQEVEVLAKALELQTNSENQKVQELHNTN